jgi:hypothetical protein
MPTPENFKIQFKNLLGSEIFAGATLSQWQSAYRETMVIMATKILEQFAAQAACDPPLDAKSTGGSGGGGNPNFVHPYGCISHFFYLPAFVLAMHEAAPKPPAPNT